MKTYAGDVLIGVPGRWNDESSYVYRGETIDLEVRVEHSPVAAPATPEGLLDTIEERMKMLGPLEEARRGVAQVDGHSGATLSVRCKRGNDKEASLMEVLVFKPTETRSVTVTAQGPAHEKAALLAAWRDLLAGLKVVEVR